MKKLLLVSVICLSGCSSLIDAYFLKYDPNEYAIISDIRTTSALSKEHCDDFQESKRNSTIISAKTKGFKDYVQHTPHNDKVINSSIELDKMGQGLKDFYSKNDKVSPAFCKLKFDSIEKSAELMQKTIGAKPR